MKKYIATLALSILTVGITAQGKAPKKLVAYSLPRSVVTVNVQSLEQDIRSGVYSHYSSSLLGLSTIEHDSTIFSISEIKLSVQNECSPSESYLISAGEQAQSAFYTLLESGYVSLPSASINKETVCRLTQKNELAPPEANSKKIYQRAQQAAEKIKLYRENRYNITIGNTDATYSGQALGDALKALEKEEQALMQDFLPSVSTYEHEVHFDFVLSKDSPQRIEAFCFSPTLGILPSGSPEGEPYYLEITLESNSPKQTENLQTKSSTDVLHYRVPAFCVIKLCYFDHVVCHLRTPVYLEGTMETINL